MKKIDPPKVGSFQDSDNQRGEIDHDTRDCAHTIKKSLAGNTALDEESSESSDAKDSWQLVLQRHIHGYKQVEVQILGCDINNEFNPFSMNIFVNSHMRETISLVVNSFDTIRYLKMKVHDKMDIPTDQQRIFFDGMQLKDTKTLLDYYIDNGDELLLVLCHRGGGSEISVMKKQITCQVDFSDTVGSLKEKIQEHEGIPRVQQSLMYAGKLFEDGLSLSDCGIQGETTLEISIPHPRVLEMKEIDPPKVRSFHDSDNLKGVEECSDNEDDWQMKIPYKNRGYIYGSNQVEVKILRWGIENESNPFGMNIFVKTLQEEIIGLVVSCLYTVDYLKVKLEKETGIPSVKQRIIFGGKQLEDGRRLLDYGVYGVHNRALFHLVLRLKGGGGLFSCPASKKQSTRPLELQLSDTVGSLKEKIQDLAGIPPAQQRFTYFGKQLEDGHSLSDLGLKSLPRLQINGEYLTTNQENRQEQTPSSSWHDSSNPQVHLIDSDEDCNVVDDNVSIVKKPKTSSRIQKCLAGFCCASGKSI